MERDLVTKALFKRINKYLYKRTFKQINSIIYIEFGSCEIGRLTRALEMQLLRNEHLNDWKEVTNT